MEHYFNQESQQSLIKKLRMQNGKEYSKVILTDNHLQRKKMVNLACGYWDCVGWPGRQNRDLIYDLISFTLKTTGFYNHLC